MDGNNSLNMHNWGYNVPTTSFESHLGLQFMSSMPEKAILGGHNVAISSTTTNGAFQHRDIGMPQAAYPVDYMRDVWLNNQREKYLNMIPTNPSYGGIPGTSAAPHQMQMTQPLEQSKDERRMEEAHVVEMANVTSENGQSSNPSIQRAPRVSKKTIEIVINGINMDISSIPIPICSCTGTPRKCYKWGSYGWQSACCTKDLSMYPLPVNTKRRSSRISGRKMTIGAFKKVIEKLAAEGYNFFNPIDLRTYWARHGTNKFVTIR